MSIIIHTNHPIATASPDHTHPHGTMQDNSTSPEFISEVEVYFDTMPLSVLDLGCAGGQLVADFRARGHEAYGIEGSDYSIVHARANWPALHNIALFTADLAKPLRITNADGSMKRFDLITAWEVIEHFRPAQLLQFFENVTRHLKFNGIFVGSVSTNSCEIHGVQYHQSIHSELVWREVTLPKALIGTGFGLVPYPFVNKVRDDYGSFHIGIARE